MARRTRWRDAAHVDFQIRAVEKGFGQRDGTTAAVVSRHALKTRNCEIETQNLGPRLCRRLAGEEHVWHGPSISRQPALDFRSVS